MAISRFTIDEKRKIVEEAYLQSSPKDMLKVAVKNNIHESTLRKWRKEYDRGDLDARYKPKVIKIKPGRKRRMNRKFSVSRKRAIVEEIGAKGNGLPTAIEVAKTHDISSSLLYGWRKLYNEGNLGGPVEKLQLIGEHKAPVEQPEKSVDAYKKLIGIVPSQPAKEPSTPEGFVPSSTVFAHMYGRSDIQVLLELYRLDRREGANHDEAFTKIIKNVRWACNYVNQNKKEDV